MKLFNKQKRNTFSFSIYISLLLFMSLSLKSFVFADTPPAFSLAKAGIMDQLKAGTKSAGYGETTIDPRIAVAGGVKIFLSVLGTIFFVLTFYAGFLILTAAGDEDKVGKAKTIIQYAVIGLIIILAAYSITSFVTRKILESTTGISSPSSPSESETGEFRCKGSAPECAGLGKSACEAAGSAIGCQWSK